MARHWLDSIYRRSLQLSPLLLGICSPERLNICGTVSGDVEIRHDVRVTIPDGSDDPTSPSKTTLSVLCIVRGLVIAKLRIDITGTIDEPFVYRNTSGTILRCAGVHVRETLRMLIVELCCSLVVNISAGPFLFLWRLVFCYPSLSRPFSRTAESLRKSDAQSRRLVAQSRRDDINMQIVWTRRGKDRLSPTT